MGRNKLAMEKIKDKWPREYAFQQRKRGILKKAAEMSILCDVEVYLAVYAQYGKEKNDLIIF